MGDDLSLKYHIFICFVFSESAVIKNGFHCFRNDPINTLRPRQDGRRFADDTFKRIFLNENIRISIKISLKFVPKGPINNNPALVQIMVWRRSGDKPLSEPMMVSLMTHICVTRPQWVNRLFMFIVCNHVSERVSKLPVISHLLNTNCPQYLLCKLMQAACV